MNQYVVLLVDDDKEIRDGIGAPIRLTPIEYKIAELLMVNAGRVFSIDEIYEKVWQEPFHNADNTVAVHIRKIRESILTYSELLKNGEGTEEERSNYIDIIDRKSKWLIVLIDDLFEASKMASGNIELVREKVDINQLLEQALAEYNDSIDESPIQFRVSKIDEPIYALVDGQKLWRAFDNLIANMLKYSLPKTRAYIQMNQEGDQLILSFKNISEYELSENIDELFERFKRGDESRHTDGSGLGLAISKSIIDLHSGSMDIGVDGDLFKVTVRFDLATA